MAKMQIPSADFSPELSRGNLKAAMADAGAKNPHSLWSVPPDQLRVIEGFNGRIRTPEYLEHLATVQASIRENGYYQDKPLAGFVAKDNGADIIYVTEGHTRFEAVRNLITEGMEFETIPVVIKPNGTSVEDLTIALVTSNEGRPFTPYETALMVKRLVGMGLDVPTIAKRLAKTQTYIDDLLTLVAAPKAVRDMVVVGHVSATLAISEVKAHGSQATGRLKAGLEKALAKGKSKVTGKHMEKPEKPTKGKKPKKDAPVPEATDDDAAQVSVERVLEIADRCGFGVGTKDLDDKLVSLAATLLDEVGASVYYTESAAQTADPAAGL